MILLNDINKGHLKAIQAALNADKHAVHSLLNETTKGLFDGGWYPIHKAVICKHPLQEGIIALLLNEAERVGMNHYANIRTGKGKFEGEQTPLWLAASYQNYQAMHVLLTHGADPNCRNQNGEALDKFFNHDEGLKKYLDGWRHMYNKNYHQALRAFKEALEETFKKNNNQDIIKSIANGILYTTRKQISSFEVEMEKLSTSNHVLISKNESLTNASHMLKANADILQHTIKKLEDEKDKLSTSLENVKAKNATFHVTENKLKAELQTINNSYEKTKEALNNIEKKLNNEYSKRMDDNEHKLKKAQNENKRLSEECSELKVKITSNEVEIEKLKNQKNNDNTNINKLESELAEKSKELNHLKQENKDQKEQHEKETSQLKKERKLLSYKLNNFYNVQLLNYVREGKDNLVEAIIALGADINSPDELGYTALHWAILENREELAYQLVVRFKGNLDKIIENGKTILEIMAEKNNAKMVEFILTIHDKDDELMKHIFAAYHLTASHEVKKQLANAAFLQSAKQGNLANVKRALEECMADIDIQKPTSGDTALHLACEYPSPDIVEVLLKHHCSVHLVNNNQQKPIERLSSNLKDTDVTKKEKSNLIKIMLLRYEAKQAIISNDYQAVQKFLEKNTDIGLDELTDHAGFSLLHLAVQSRCQAEIVSLLAKKSKVNEIESHSGQTPLHMAVKAGSIELTGTLLKNGAHINEIENRNGQTALHMAVEIGNLELVELLLKNGAVLNIKDKQERLAEDCTTHKEIIKTIGAQEKEIKLKNELKPKTDEFKNVKGDFDAQNRYSFYNSKLEYTTPNQAKDENNHLDTTTNRLQQH